MLGLKQTTIAIAAVATFAGAIAINSNEANAAGLVMPTITTAKTSLDVNTGASIGNGEAQIIKVGSKRKRFKRAIRKSIRHHNRHHRGGIYFHAGPIYHDCVWKKKRYWDSYHGHYYHKRVKVCY